VVLTAAHCISSRNQTTNEITFDPPKSVRIKPQNRQDGTTYTVSKVYINPGWMCDGDTLALCPGGVVGVNVDLALLKLSEFSNNPVVCLNTDNSRPANGVTLDTMGFGEVSNDVGSQTFQGGKEITNLAACSTDDPGFNSADYFCTTPGENDPHICGGKNLSLTKIYCDNQVID